MMQLRYAFRNAFRRWLRRWKLRRAYRHAIVGVDLSTTGDMAAGPPVNPTKPSAELPPSVARSVALGEAFAAGLAAGLEAPPATLYADNRPVVTIRADGIDAFIHSLREIARLAMQAAAAFRAIATAATDADLIDKYGTSKEIHYIMHHHKARTRKKYRNRVLRRARRDERRTRHEKNRTPRA